MRSVYHQIARFDVGVSPLLDTEFNRGKSAFKLKQCLSCGIPFWAAVLARTSTFLQEGVNGYFCGIARKSIWKGSLPSGTPVK